MSPEKTEGLLVNFMHEASSKQLELGEGWLVGASLTEYFPRGASKVFG